MEVERGDRGRNRDGGSVEEIKEEMQKERKTWREGEIEG